MKKTSMEFDIVVIGGGPGGIPAAMTAARNGAKVLLVEKNGYLGGNMTIGLPLLGFLDKDGRTVIRRSTAPPTATAPETAFRPETRHPSVDSG